MKLSTVTLGFLVTDALSAAIAIGSSPGAIAIEHIPRQISVITGVLDAVGADIDELDAAILGFTGDPADVEARAADLVATLQSGKSTVDGSASLSLADSLSLQGPVRELTETARTLKDDLIAKRPVIIENSLCARTRTITADIDTNSNALIDSVVSKVPTAAQPIAESLAADLRGILAEASAAFSEANCPA